MCGNTKSYKETCDCKNLKSHGRTLKSHAWCCAIIPMVIARTHAQHGKGEEDEKSKEA